MFRIVIVDDEPWALRGLRDIIDWENYGFSQIDCFQDPREALETIRAKGADAVLTDVKMPVMSGLELMQCCRDMGSDALFCVVSAYAEFEYAKAALEIGAVSYVLKPLDESIVREVAVKLRKLLSQRKASALEHEVRSLVLHALITGKIASVDSALARSGLFREAYTIAFLETMPDEIPGQWFPICTDLGMLIMEPGTILPQDCYAGISLPGDTPADAPRCVWQALVAYYSQRFYRISAPLCWSDCGHLEPGITEQIVEDIRAGNPAKAHAKLDIWAASAQNDRVLIHELTFSYNELLKEFFSLHPQKEVQENLRRFSSCFQMYSVIHTADVLFGSLRVLLDDCLCGTGSEAEQHSGAAERAVQYVDKHYHEALTLEDLSVRFNISLAHLSRQFKRITGVPYTEYIKEKRIEKACNLLLATHLSIAEIGEQVGYPDCFHFSKQFKKVKGISPTAYRKEGTGNEKP